MSLSCGVIHYLYTTGSYCIAPKWQGKNFLVLGFVGLPVTWYLICGHACGESHTSTRNSGRLQVLLTCCITWFSALYLNAMNRSEDFWSHRLAWNVRPATALRGGGGKWRWSVTSRVFYNSNRSWEQLGPQNSFIFKSATYLGKMF